MQEDNHSRTITVILGIGNPIMGDDGVGPYIVSRLKAQNVKFKLIDGGTVPENYIQKIIDIKPDRILIIDAVDFGGRPGEVRHFKEISSANISISTHNIPAELFIESISRQTGADIAVVGIQPKQIKLNTPLSREVKESADRLIKEMLY